jgi:hypothetical protein
MKFILTTDEEIINANYIISIYIQSDKCFIDDTDAIYKIIASMTDGSEAVLFKYKTLKKAKEKFNILKQKLIEGEDKND